MLLRKNNNDYSFNILTGIYIGSIKIYYGVKTKYITTSNTN